MHAIQSKAHAGDLLAALAGDCHPEYDLDTTPRRAFYHAFMAQGSQQIIDPQLGTPVLAQFGWFDTQAYAFAIAISQQIIIPYTFAGEYIMRINPHWASTGIDFTFSGDLYHAIQFIWAHRTYINAALKSFKAPHNED